MRCAACLGEELGFGKTECEVPGHGTQFIDYKCRFCCNLALYVCYQGTHFCDSCHLKACRQTLNFYRDPREIQCSSKTLSWPPQ